jgi:hypothetical protein
MRVATNTNHPQLVIRTILNRSVGECADFIADDFTDFGCVVSVASFHGFPDAIVS